ncbi:MAG: glycine/betaine ABC transporter substrate-binding protein [Actinomycetales bacterium]|nr:MAG: glycine/betaine ABC transporter substrate-binding protein [Actinomycetales bacterium]
MATSLAACSGGGSDDKTITLGFIPAWTDGLSTAYLLKNQLEQKGYKVEMKEITEAGVLYTGLANGDVDIYPSAWSEVTHADYMKKYNDKLEDLGAYYGNAKLTWAVPEYSKITSIADIPNYADKLENKIIGIEPGAGLTKASKDKVIPDYGLDKFELVTSSTTAMLAELKSATDAKKEIVVTLWRPFWANSTFKMRDLEDPKGSLGGSEALHFLATKGFSEKHPDVAEWIGKIKLDDNQYGSLEDTVVNKFGKEKAAEGVAAWIEENGKDLDFINS